jgi:hypothetical protein
VINRNEARELAARRVGAVHGDAQQRVALAEESYRPQFRAYGRAELAFLRGELTRGVLDPETGSPWWRAVNDRLLHDKLEAALLHRAGSTDASTPGARLWAEFLTAPSPSAWYRPHNRSVVSGYMEHLALAEAEPANWMNPRSPASSTMVRPAMRVCASTPGSWPRIR